MSNSDETEKQGEQDLVFPPSFSAKAIRHGPYRNSSNAMAEIVDNSYDAKADEIHIALICDAGSANKHPHTIAVLDNGVGMDRKSLRRSIQYGCHQEHQGKRTRSNLGKFGVGLLSASFNQCKHLEVYSWTEGLREEINSTSCSVEKCPLKLPPVQLKSLPGFFEQAFASFDREKTGLDTHGTLVIWREIDKLSWKKAETLLKHLQAEIGRIYRNFLDDPEEKEKLRVRIAIIEQSDTEFKVAKQIYVKPVDPLFLSHWDCVELKTYLEDLKTVGKNPENYDVKPEQIKFALENKTLFIPFDFENENDNGFNEDGSFKVAEYTVKDDIGKEIGKYRIIASYRWPQIVRAAAEAGSKAWRNPGHTKYGKLAENLRGVSIMRSGRELTLDANWLRADQTIDRWVSLSLDFDPSLDEFFGVSNDKQYAAHLASLAQVKFDTLDKDNYNTTVLEAAKYIHMILAKMRNLVKQKDSAILPKPKLPTDPASEVNLNIISRKLSNRSDRNPLHIIHGIDDKDPEKNKLKEAYNGATIENEKAAVVRPQILVDNNLKVDIVTDPIASDADMFSPINNASGAMIIRLHAKHPLYETMQDILKSNDEDEATSIEELDPKQLQQKLSKAFTVLRTLIIGYSRAELEADKRSKEHFERVRREWSYVTRDLFEKDE